MEELVSIIMPTYNCADYILETIRSVQAQTWQNWELLIVDDCSSDNTEDVLKPVLNDDSRITYHKLPTNFGAAMARNKAMELAKGDYMAFLDSDDIWLPEKLEKQIGFMKTNGILFSCTAYEWIDEKSKPLNKIINTVNRVDYNRLLLDCPVGNSTVMYDVSALGKFKTPNIRKRNDDALWLQILKKEEYIYGMEDVLMRYRIRTNSISHNKLSLVKYHWKLYRDIEHLSVPRSIFHIAYWGVIKILHIK